MNISFIPRWSIKHPVFVVAAYLSVLAIAIYALVVQLPMWMMPYVQSPLVAIVTTAPSSSPQEIERQITQPIEQQMQKLKGVRYVRSTSQADLSYVTVQFNWGQNMQQALQAVQSGMKTAAPQLPAEIVTQNNYQVLPFDPLNRPVLTLALRGESSEWEAGRLRAFADRTVVDRLSKLENVQSVSVFSTVGNLAIDSRYRHNGDLALGINVIQTPNTSAPQVIKQVRAEIQNLQQQYPGLDFQEAFDNSHLVKVLRDNTIGELLVSVLLTDLVILLFLERFRATAIVLISIPVSIAISVLPFVPMGMSLNSSTLIGMMLAIGRLVDDSIVVIESVDRQLQAGKSPRQAAIQGTQEVFLAIAAATLVMIAALFPMIFAGGLTGLMFAGIVYPIIYALLASLVVSLTLTPLLAAYLLRVTPAAESTWIEKILTPFRHSFNWLEIHYTKLLDWALGHRRRVLAVAAAFILTGFSLAMLIGMEMMPLGDSGQFMVMLEAQPNTSLTQTDKIAQQFEQLLLKQPEVEQVSSEVGFEPITPASYLSGTGMGSMNSINMMVTVKDRAERDRDIWQVIDSVEAEAKRTLPGIRAIAMQAMGVDVMSTAAAPVQVAVYGKELSNLHQLADQILQIAQSIPGFVMPHTSAALMTSEDQEPMMIERVNSRRVVYVNGFYRKQSPASGGAFM